MELITWTQLQRTMVMPEKTTGSLQQGRQTHGTGGKSCKQPAEVAPQGDGGGAQKDALVHSLVLG